MNATAKEAKALYQLLKRVEEQKASLIGVMDLELSRGHGTALAKRLGVTPQFVSDVRNGRRSFGMALLLKLSRLEDLG